MNVFGGRRVPRAGAELVLIATLAAVALLSYIGALGSLEDLSPAGRAVYLANWSTNENLGLGFLVLLGAVVALPLRHFSALASLAVTSAVTTALFWWYPMLSRNIIVSSIVLAIAAGWFTWKVERWWLVAAFLAPPLAAAGIRIFEINDRFEQINAGPSSDLASVSAIVQDALFHLLAVGLGLIVRRFGLQSTELAERNIELENERANTAAAAVTDERLRISRELHDVVAHHVTTMTVHAGAARQLVETSPDKAADSMRHIESAGRTAVNELHNLLGFLRGRDALNEDDDRAPTPSLKHLETLRESFGPKLASTINVTGDVDSVPPAVDVSAYRIVQEALTNTLKHSTAKTADVIVEIGGDAVVVTITDNGNKAARFTQQTKVGGHGLVGMRERASLHGGDLKAGPRSPDGGWQVWARLPFGATS